MATDSKGRTIAYWVLTGLLAAGMASGGIMDLMAPPEAVAGFEHLGYPTHLLTLLGIAKLLAVVTILAPGFARLKEWAYAGMAIDVIGAGWSHVFSSDPVGQWLPFILLFLALVFGSYFLRPSNRRLPDLKDSAK
jgi:uncharacterized membrane protein YphA (DoxX/SURF4 family)